MPSQVFESKRHDTATSPQPTFSPPPDLGWDLTEDGMVCTFIARHPDSEIPKIKAPAVVVGPWTVRYDPVPGDVDMIGSFDVEVECVRANGKKLTLPTVGWLSWVIGPDLDDA